MKLPVVLWLKDISHAALRLSRRFDYRSDSAGAQQLSAHVLQPEDPSPAAGACQCVFNSTNLLAVQVWHL